MSDNHLTDLLVALAKADVKFIICGGVAAVLHGVERMTLDLDITVDMKNGNMKKFLDIIGHSDLKPRVPIPSETLLDPEKIRHLVEEKNARVFTFTDMDKPWRQVDVFLTDDYAYHTLLHDTETIQIGGYPMLVVSKDRLIQMKKSVHPQREKDLLDIKSLTRLKGEKQ